MKKLTLSIAMLALVTMYGCKKDEDSKPVTKPQTVSLLVKSISVTKMPFVNSVGEPWDNEGGPDMYFTLADPEIGTLVNGRESIVNNVIESDLPVKYTFKTPLEITDLTSTCAITLYDADIAPDEDDYIGAAMFTWNTKTNDAARTITLEERGVKYVLDVDYKIQ